MSDPFNDPDPLARLRRERLFREAHALGPRPMATVLLETLRDHGGDKALRDAEARVAELVQLGPLVRILGASDFPAAPLCRVSA